MRILVTTLLSLLAFALGVVATGYLGDQGRGLDLMPFLVGSLLAVGVVLARSRRRSSRTSVE